MNMQIDIEVYKMATWLSEKSVTVIAVLVALVAVGAPLWTGNAVATYGASSLPTDFSVNSLNVPSSQLSNNPWHDMTATFGATGSVSHSFVDWKLEVSNPGGFYYRSVVGQVNLPANGEVTMPLESRDRNQFVDDLPAGTYTAKLTVDNLNNQPETDEANNMATVTVVAK